MTPNEQEILVNMFKLRDIQNKYREMYGSDWRNVYEEDKENGCLLKVD